MRWTIRWRTVLMTLVTFSGLSMWMCATQKASPIQTTGRFVFTIVSANRPGNHSYVASTLQSLYCALGVPVAQLAPATPVGLPDIPTVLLVNTEVPASKHVVLQALSNDPKTAQYLKHGLKFAHVPTLHSQLHAPQYVQELAKRTAVDYKVGC